MSIGTKHYVTSICDRDGPFDWAPLRDLVGFELADWFMGMFEFRLEDGVLVHAYKHSVTRRYLFLADDGRAFAWRAAEPDHYVEISRADAIVLGFRDWDCLGGGPEDPDAQIAMLAFATETADAGKTMPWSPELAAQRDAELRAAYESRSADAA